ncbi:hypothetical protein X794_00525 [Dehalococcoides mccartyi CG5]|nr:hypothetical protein X794_00525 [Dehalococcoides mccartyi CG5]
MTAKVKELYNKLWKIWGINKKYAINQGTGILR